MPNSLNGCVQGEKNVVFINVSWGLGMGLIINGELYYGKSGFSGEFDIILHSTMKLFMPLREKGMSRNASIRIVCVSCFHGKNEKWRFK